MKASVFFILYVLLFGNIPILKAQVKDKFTEQYAFFDNSLDLLYINGTKYLMERTPLQSFKGYDQLYPEITEIITGETFSGNGQIDKNYAIDWIVIDNTLYLSDIHLEAYFREDSVNFTKYFSNNEEFVRMEQLIQRKFEKYKYLKGFTYISNPYGVLEASWVTGKIHIKKPYSQNESKEEWNAAPSYRLVFNKGKLMSMSEVPAYIDTFTGFWYVDDKLKKEWTLRLEFKNGKIVDIKRLKYRKSKNINPKSKAS